MRRCVGFENNAVLTFPFLSGLRYFPVSAKHAGRREMNGRSLLHENRACFLVYDDHLTQSAFPLARQAHRHFYSRSRRTDLTS
jgi:hypothetical protein